MEPTYTTYDLDDFFKHHNNELTGKHVELDLPRKMVQQMTMARFHELACKGPIPSFVKLVGLLGRHAWHLDVPYRPYKLHIALWSNDLCARATTYAAALDLLDELKDALEHDTAMRSAVLRGVVAGIPGVTEEEQVELEAYARAAGM